jgi:hypothetical protein
LRFRYALPFAPCSPDIFADRLPELLSFLSGELFANRLSQNAWLVEKHRYRQETGRWSSRQQGRQYFRAMRICRAVVYAGDQLSVEADTMIEIFRIPISKQQLRAIPADERNLLLLTSHAVNQISILRKILVFSLHFSFPSGFAGPAADET